MTHFMIDVQPDFAPDFEQGAAELLGWKFFEPTPWVDPFGRGMLRYWIDADAPAEAEGKLIEPIFQRSADDVVTVMDWGIPK